MSFFTKSEQRVLVFLWIFFVLGLGVRFYQKRFGALPDPVGPVSLTDETVDEMKSAEFNPRETVKGDSAQRSSGGDVKQEILDPVSINSAPASRIADLPGVGPVLAERVVAYRSEHGPFQSVEELIAVKGIGRKKLALIQPYILLN